MVGDCINIYGVECPACTGESCYKCGAGVWRYTARDGMPCDHHVDERHENITPGICPIEDSSVRIR